MGIEHLAVPPELLTASCNPDDLGFETTDEVSPLEGTIGQERAESALELGLNIDAPGFNLFVAGPPGTGRNTALRSYVERVARRKSEPPDWGYVHNFRDPAQPVAISLSCGMMRAFAEDMNDLVDGCRLEIPRAFEGDDYTRRVDEAMKEIQARRQKLTEGIDSAARAEGFVLTSTPAGISPVPVVEDRPMSGEEFTALSDERRGQLREKSDALQPQINRFMADIRRLNKEAVERAREVDTEIVKFTLQPIIHELQDRYRPFPPVVEYLDRVEADLVAHLDVFKTKEEQPSGPPGLPAALGEEDPFVKYRVNDLVDNSMCDGAPVIFEYSPSYYNLFGRIDYRARFGAIATDLTMIKAGALHRANGGYLVVQAKDILASPMSYETLKRSLRSQEIRIENIGEQYSPLPSATLRPQPIPLNAKVIVVGSQGTLRWLQALDDDFRRYFKVTADFDTLMERSTENLGKYASFVAERCRESGLRPFHKSGVASVIDYSSRLVEHQDKLTTRFMDVADIITEANYWAGVDNSNVVSGAHVERAVSQRNYRNSLTEDRLQELIEEGTIHIDTEGAVVGQVNALAVLAVGDHVFGKPSRISARVSLGRGQLINVERETKLTGRIHDKGFMVLTGYLQGKYGRDKPLSLSARISFEQTYSEVDGDSASSTELYSLLPELSGLPLRQGIAVTGSVNQAGEVQAIGGATAKIEGFFDLCRARGLTGDQGVMVPRDNLKNLILKREVVEAVRDGRFHVYGVSTIDEGIEVLSGTPAGRSRDGGTYEEGTVHYLVEERLTDLAEKARNLDKPDAGENKGPGGDEENGEG